MVVSAAPRELLTGDELGWRLAGIADGEGCFSILRRPRKQSLHCNFIVGVRSDDRPMLELLCESTGLGTIYDRRLTARAVELRPGANEVSAWCISRKHECAELTDLFRRYPPISKKRRDFDLWARGVAAWLEQDWALMRSLAEELSDARKYVQRAAA